MIRQYLAIAAFLLIAAAFMGGEIHGRKTERTKQEAARASAIEAARQTEREQQEAINSALQIQVSELAGINAGLADDLARLRSRPPRRVPQAAKVDCQGATGAELSREDAGFLVGEAARADRQRAALTACYAAYDSITETAE